MPDILSKESFSDVVKHVLLTYVPLTISLGELMSDMSLMFLMVGSGLSDDHTRLLALFAPFSIV